MILPTTFARFSPCGGTATNEGRSTMMDQGQREYRTNLINRRTVAWLLEISVIRHLTTVLVATVLPFNVLSWVLPGLWILLRDVKTTSWGKRVLGLEVVSCRSDAPVADTKARLLRNLPLLVPLVAIVEFFVAYGAQNTDMQRLGDRLAETRIRDASPEHLGNGTFVGPLVGTVFGLGLLEYAVTAMLTQ